MAIQPKADQQQSQGQKWSQQPAEEARQGQGQSQGQQFNQASTKAQDSKSKEHSQVNANKTGTQSQTLKK